MDGSVKSIKKVAAEIFWRRPFINVYSVFIVAFILFALYKIFEFIALFILFSGGKGGSEYALGVLFIFLGAPLILGLVRFFSLSVGVKSIGIYEIFYFYSSGESFFRALRFCLSYLLYIAAKALPPLLLFTAAFYCEDIFTGLLSENTLLYLCVFTELAAFASLFILCLRIFESFNAAFVFVRFESLSPAFAFEQALRGPEGSFSLILSFWLSALACYLTKGLLIIPILPYLLFSLILNFEHNRSSKAI